METFDAISQRRSIRKFKKKEISEEIIEKIVLAGIQAPSAKNRQPWKFVVVTDKEKAALLKAMRKGIENEIGYEGLLPNCRRYIAGAENTAAIMEQAPVTILVFNTGEYHLWDHSTVENKLYNMADIQTIGAAIQNMIVAATDIGIGSLWICDIFFAYREICEWLNEENQLVAAVAFGYPDECPPARPRKALNEVVEWK